MKLVLENSTLRTRNKLLSGGEKLDLPEVGFLNLDRIGVHLGIGKGEW